MMAFGTSIVLSIKPEYARKIFSGEKKYEFRRKLCTKDIDKLYLYVTSPVGRIMGEAEVVGKYFMEKQRLWALTHELSGIAEDAFFGYFMGRSDAGAYELGKVVQYETPVNLEKIGIHFVPQSFVYVDTLKEPGGEARTGGE